MFPAWIFAASTASRACSEKRGARRRVSEPQASAAGSNTGLQYRTQPRAGPSNMTNLMHWRLLVAIADTGSVSSAAERCGITQSGASQAISQLEDMLGIRVLVRDRRKTTVTSIGEP